MYIKTKNSKLITVPLENERLLISSGVKDNFGKGVANTATLQFHAILISKCVFKSKNKR